MTFRNAVFQLHWLLGITAGLVLALVGVTGAMMSFEPQILKAMNAGVLTVSPRGQALPPAALLARVLEQRPGQQPQSLSLVATAGDAARVTFAPAPDAPKGANGRARGESVHVDPYTGKILGKPVGEGFFRTTMELHRWLALDKVGKQIVGASTIVLIFFCISGIYLRWPRRWWRPRAWFALDWRQRGRNFLWHLHAVAGTWMLVIYLVCSMTGLWWSYGWYRDGLNRWAGLPMSQAQRGGSAKAADGRNPSIEVYVLDLERTWRAFDSQVPAWSKVTLQWPRGDTGVQFRYVDADPAHDRASNTLELDVQSLSVLKHERYDDKPLPQRLVGSMLALHSGSYFGLTGLVIFMLASALMPLFAITGWMLYLDRRRRQRDNQRAALEAGQPTVAAGDRFALVAYASQTGTAARLAWQSAALLRQAGHEVTVTELGKLRPESLPTQQRVFMILSTFGDGQAPDQARAFERAMRSAEPDLSRVGVAVLALGDSSYGEDFCGFGRAVDRWLRHCHAQPMFDRVEVDGDDEGAIRHWQHHLAQLVGRNDIADWQPAHYRPWTLAVRQHLNPGSAGGEAYHLELLAPAPADLHWEAGDIAEIGPRHADSEVQAWLAAAGLAGTLEVMHKGSRRRLDEVLAETRLPEIPRQTVDPRTWADGLIPLPHREYSIASLPVDGHLDLLVRKVRHDDGRLGTGSGWLTEFAPIGSGIQLRIRRNPSFHVPDDPRPTILIGNGTGLAGLRAVLKTRVARGHHRNWLLFGERSAAHDGFHRDELLAWQAGGAITHLHLVYSRDGGAHRYVQDRLRAEVALLTEWLNDGAAVYVCGSLEGMAPAVDTVLHEVLGEDALESMLADGRYRRDVY